jgi:hypothetical protein
MKGVCEPADVQKVQLEQVTNPNNLGIGVIDASTGKIGLFSFDETDRFVAVNPHVQVMAGHEAAAFMAGFIASQTRGFVLGFDPSTGQWQIANRSHLNFPDGAGLRMAPQTFTEVVDALFAAGVTNPVVMK